MCDLGYSIFIVKGVFPANKADEVAITLPDPSIQRFQGDVNNSVNSYEDDLKAAIEASLQSYDNQVANNNDNGINNDDRKKVNNNENNNSEDNKSSSNEEEVVQELSPEDLRAKRIARFEKVEKNGG